MNPVREWAQRLLVPALLTCIGLLHVRAGDYHMAGAHLTRKSQLYLERVREMDTDARLMGHLETVTKWLEARQYATFRLMNCLLLIFVVFSLAWLVLAREPLKFRVLTLAAVWLSTFGFWITRPIY